MRYALISDIHGNMDALQAVLNDAANRNIDHYIFLGDYTIILHQPNEVATRIRRIPNRTVIRGNHEDYLSRLTREDPAAWQPGQFGPMYYAYQETSQDNLDFLLSLPKQTQLHDGGQRIAAFHDVRQYLGGTKLAELGCRQYALRHYPHTGKRRDYIAYAREALGNDAAFLQALDTLPDGIYLYGHNHIQSTFDFGRVLLVNPGSCGVPLDGDPRAPYSVLDISSSGRHVEELRVAYDTHATIRQLRSSRLYTMARVFCELMISELETGFEHTSFFFDYVAAYAKAQSSTAYPYPRAIWDAAYDLWDGAITPG